jgi:hypothetical protein
MRSLFLTAPCLLVILTIGFLTGYVDSHKSATPTYISSGQTYYVFVIGIDLRGKQDDVENILNWRFLGNITDNIPSCGSGVLQACQLIVDEHDTEVSKDKIRLLKSDVIISASLNKKANIWYVSKYTTDGSYFYQILNEDDDLD